MSGSNSSWIDGLRRWRSALLPAAAGFGLTIYLFYPGFMSWDSTAQYEQVVTGRIANAHPPIMVYLWSLSDAIITGPGGLFLIHVAAYWSGWALIVGSLARSWLARLLLLTAVGFFPPLIGLVPMLWKDAGSLSALLLATGMLLLARSSGRRSLVRAALLPLFYAAAVRSLDLLAVLPLLWVVAGSYASPIGRMGEAWGRHRRRLASFALLTAIFVGGIAAISSIGVERRPYRAAVPLWDLAILSLMRHEMLIPEYAIHPPGLEIARLRAITRAWRCDFYDHADGLNVTTDMQYTNLTHLEADRLIRDWLLTITRHPGAYAAHRWRISRRLFSDPMMKLHHRMESIPSFRLPFRFERRPGYEPVHRMLKGATRTLLYEPWLYLLLTLAALAVSFATPGAEARLARALASSGLLSVIHLPVTAPSIDFRYSIWLIAAGLIAWLLLARALGTRVLASR